MALWSTKRRSSDCRSGVAPVMRRQRSRGTEDGVLRVEAIHVGETGLRGVQPAKISGPRKKAKAFAHETGGTFLRQAADERRVPEVIRTKRIQQQQQRHGWR